jgi:hypothetical protein
LRSAAERYTGTVKTSCGILLLVLCGGVAALAQPTPVVVKAGDVDLTLPAPGKEFVEVGPKLRTMLFELMAPATNRLIAAYAPTQQAVDLNAGKKIAGLDAYALVEVPRQAEYIDCPPEAFDEILKGMEPAFGALDKARLGALEEELNIHLKTLGAKALEIGKPEMLGGVFRKTDAAGYAMLAPYKDAERTLTMASTIVVVRLRRRLIFAYFYRKYESPETVQKLRKEGEAWSDSLQAANR